MLGIKIWQNVRKSSCFFHMICLILKKKKRLGHCYDAIYTLLYLLLSPNNLLRLKKTSESNHLLSLQNNYSEWKINLLPERIEPVKAFMIILFFPSPFLNEWYYYQLVGVVGWRSLKGLMFPLHFLCFMRVTPPRNICNEKKNWFPLLQRKITMSIWSFTMQHRKSV